MINGLLLMLDDIALIADDVATLSKMAVKKTSGVLGDDLALNAEQVNGISTNRELPVVYKVFKGSLINKAILVPIALLLNYFMPWLLIPLLMIGGAYLCYEAFETIHSRLFEKEALAHNMTNRKELVKDMTAEELLKYENAKIKNAVKTDFVLSAEILVISLSVMAQANITTQIIALTVMAIFFTVLVYGLVALIVRLDDMGFWLEKKKSAICKKVGHFMIISVPYLMRLLSEIGLIAMCTVGGGLILHGIHSLDTWLKAISPDGWMGILTMFAANVVVAIITGFIVWVAHIAYVKVKDKIVK